MRDENRHEIIGNIGKDPEARTTSNGAVMCNLNVATNRNYKDRSGEWQSETDWHRVVLFGKAAEYAEHALKKGDRVRVVGRVTTRKWQDKDGNDRYSTETVGFDVCKIERDEPKAQADAPMNQPIDDDIPF